MLVENNTAEKNESTSATDRLSAFRQTPLSEYNIPSAVINRLRLQNTLDRIDKVS